MKLQMKTRQSILDVTIMDIIALLFVAAASLSIVYFKGIGVVDFGDGQDYLRSAASIFSEQGYLREGLTWPFFRPPGYPFVIACIWKVLGVESIIALKLFNILLHLLSTLIISKILRHHYNQNTAIVGMILFGLNPFVLLPLADIQTEPLILFLFLVFSYFLVKQSTYLNLALTALLALLITAVRPEYLFVILVICLILLFSRLKSQKTVIKSLCILFVLTFSLSWWGVQNKKATGSFIVLTNATDYLLWNGSTEQIYENYSLSLRYNPHFDTEQYISIQDEIQRNVANWGSSYSNTTIGKKSLFWRSAYFENVKASPLRYFAKTLEKMTIFWRPFLNPNSHGIKTSGLSMLILLPITIGTVLSLFNFRRKVLKDILVLSYLSGLGVLTIVHMFQMPDQRYKFPLLIPLSSIILAPFIWQILSSIPSKLGFFTIGKKKKEY